MYFSSAIFREKIEATGASYRRYSEDLDIFKAEGQSADGNVENPLLRVLRSAERILDDIFAQIDGIRFDYLIHSAAFPFTTLVAQRLQIPTVSSLAVFAGLSDFFAEGDKAELEAFPQMEEMAKTYKEVAQTLREKYAVRLPDNLFHLLLNKGDLNFIYTSEYFIAPADRAFFDDTYQFVGPPIYERKESLDFPFDQLAGRTVVYISLGTVFGNFNPALYGIFFQSFADMDAVVVLAAYQVDLSALSIPQNFIVRSYVLQSEILKYTDVAVTHAGMNSISDLIYGAVPFVAIPLGADQPVLAKRAEELGATIALDAESLTPEILRNAIETVLNDPSYRRNIETIKQSFREAGGYKKAVEEIFKLKREKGIDQ